MSEPPVTPDERLAALNDKMDKARARYDATPRWDCHHPGLFEALSKALKIEAERAESECRSALPYVAPTPEQKKELEDAVERTRKDLEPFWMYTGFHYTMAEHTCHYRAYEAALLAHWKAVDDWAASLAPWRPTDE